jgi:hypothetical protein
MLQMLGRKLKQSSEESEEFLLNDFTFPGSGPRIEGTGTYGAAMNALLARINELAASKCHGAFGVESLGFRGPIGVCSMGKGLGLEGP